MPPISILICIGFLVFLVWLVIKLKNSSKFDKFCEDLTEDVTPNSTDEIIKDIKESEADLNKQVKENKKQSDEISKDTKVINNYFSNKGDVK